MVRVEARRKADLPHVVAAHDVLALLPDFSQDGNQHSHQQRDYGNDHQQFYQCKTTPVPARLHLWSLYCHAPTIPEL